MPSLSNVPSGAPSISSLPTEQALPEIRIVDWDLQDGGALQNCEGHCDINEDCQTGLICLRRDLGEDVPGCAVPNDNSTEYAYSDICVVP